MVNEKTSQAGLMDKVSAYSNSKLFPIISAFIIAISIIAVYSNIYDNSIHFDDTFIFDNPNLQDPNNFDNLFSVNKFRIVPFWTLAVNYASSDAGNDLSGFYTVNILIHIINSLFAFGIIFYIFKSPVIRDLKIARHGATIAFFVGLMFALHPLQTQGVTYIYQRLASIAATFYYGAILAYLVARITQKGLLIKITLYLAAFVFLVLGLFSKENVFTIFPMILLIELTLFNKNFKLSPVVVGTFIGITALGFILFLQFQVPSNIFKPLENFNGEIITSQNYLITQFKVLPLYLKLFILPFGQNFDHDIRVSESVFDGSVLLGLGVLLALLVYAFYMYKYNRMITFGVIWFFLTISVESSIIPIADVVFEHRVYLPMLGLLMAFTASLYELFARREKLIDVFLILMLFLSVFNGVLANQRNNVWDTELTLWTDAVEKSPEKARAYFKRGQANLASNKVNSAMSDFNKVIELRPEFVSAYTYRAAINLSLKKKQEAIADYDKFIKFAKDKSDGYLARARAYAELKMAGRAIDDYKNYLKIKKDEFDVHLEMATMYEQINDAANAINSAHAAFKSDTSSPRAAYLLGRYYFMTAKFDSAEFWLDKAIMNPNIQMITAVDAFNTKGSLYFYNKNYEEALKSFLKAYKANDKYEPVIVNLALVYRNLGQYENELEMIDKVISFNDKNAENWYIRGICNHNLKRYKEAVQDFEKALELDRTLRDAEIRRLMAQRML
ncbi:MAG: tetratricopeptide repeat protein [Candidatus Kapaibacterium sp.]